MQIVFYDEENEPPHSERESLVSWNGSDGDQRYVAIVLGGVARVYLENFIN